MLNFLLTLSARDHIASRFFIADSSEMFEEESQPKRGFIIDVFSLEKT